MVNLDLFHQLYYEDSAYTAVADYTDNIPQVNVYDPNGDWCGCTNASSHYARIAAVKEIVKTRKLWTQRQRHIISMATRS